MCSVIFLMNCKNESKNCLWEYKNRAKDTQRERERERERNKLRIMRKLTGLDCDYNNYYIVKYERINVDNTQHFKICNKMS